MKEEVQETAERPCVISWLASPALKAAIHCISALDLVDWGVLQPAGGSVAAAVAECRCRCRKHVFKEFNDHLAWADRSMQVLSQGSLPLTGPNRPAPL